MSGLRLPPSRTAGNVCAECSRIFDRRDPSSFQGPQDVRTLESFAHVFGRVIWDAGRDIRASSISAVLALVLTIMNPGTMAFLGFTSTLHTGPSQSAYWATYLVIVTAAGVHALIRKRFALAAVFAALDLIAGVFRPILAV